MESESFSDAISDDSQSLASDVKCPVIMKYPKVKATRHRTSDARPAYVDHAWPHYTHGSSMYQVYGDYVDISYNTASGNCIGLGMLPTDMSGRENVAGWIMNGND